MQISMQKYKKRMLVLSVMLLVVVLLSGVSYAVFTSFSSQTDANTLAASCMDLDFNGQNEINLTNTYPVKDGEALESTPYTFTIKNKCDNYIEYYVIASVINTSNLLDSKYVKVSLLGDNDLTSSPITDLEAISTPQSLSEYSITSNYVLKKGDGISKDESRTFNYRMWVNGDLQDSWTSEDVESKNYQVKISVVGTVKTRPKDDLFIATTIDGTASSSFPETNAYSASVSCTQDDKSVDIGATIKWTGSKWSLGVTNLTSGNTKCTVAFDPPTLADAILQNNEVKEPMTTPGKEASAHILNDIESATVTVSSTNKAKYITYGTGWTMNGTKFNLTGTGVTSGTYETSYSSLVGKYLAMSQYGFDFVDIGSTTAGTMKTTTNIYALAYVVSATADNIEYKFLTSNKNTTESLLTSTQDDYGMSYYFRGAVKNNYVEFANKCWRIVRIVGDGSVKLVLHNDNISNSSNPCSSMNNSDEAAFAHYSGSTYVSAFNSNYNDNAYIGFMYGQAGSSDYASTHANTNKSTILTNLETWYTNNLTSYADKLADTIRCNDKSTFTTYASGSAYGTGLGYGTNLTGYGAFKRVKGEGGKDDVEPSLICPNDNNGGKLSKFTVSDTTNGNGNLTYKIGLLTADEVEFVGGMFNSYNYSTFLEENTGNILWSTMSSAGYIGNYAWNLIIGHGFMNIGSVNDTKNALRPAIALTSSTTISGGSGTSEDPYVVK